jgi:hypothetical protein
MKAGDVVEVEVDAIGVLRNQVVAEPAQALAGVGAALFTGPSQA